MLNPEVRKLLETTFKSQVADVYACSEAGDIAWQCTQGTDYHINADNIVVEIVKDGRRVKDGQVGEVVITNLNRLAMPIIRYKNGDLARLASQPQPCPCGCKLPAMAEIVGRMSDDISLPDGRIVPWKQVRDLMVLPHVRQYQLLQNASGDLEVRYVPERAADTDSIQDTLMHRYKQTFGPSVRIQIGETDNIKPASSGKGKYIISNYRPAKQAVDNCRKAFRQEFD
jgi:phenylacetate-CoA ligase